MSDIEILKILGSIALVLYLATVTIETWKDFKEAEKEEENKRGK